MALEQAKLDNLTWTQMVTAIRRRIPAASEGEWTLHSPVDPGVTLLELFAYLLEQRVFWLDQIPDSLVHAALSLMGQSVNAARPAATVMQFSPQLFEKLAALDEFNLAKSVPPLIFSIDDEVLLLPCAEFVPERCRLNIFANGSDRTPDLVHGRRICLLPAGAEIGEVKIVIWLEQPVPAANDFGDFFSLFVELETAKEIEPQWSQSAVDDVPAPAKLSWWYHDQVTGKPEAFADVAVQDGTIGLRRSGLVRLRVPPNWQSEPADPSLPGLTPYALILKIEAATFTVPPVLRRIAPNVAIARHQRQTQQHEFKVDWLPLPGQTVNLLDRFTTTVNGLPLQDYPPLDESIKLKLKERDGEFEWQPVRTLTFHGPDERVFLVDREKGLLKFGNGLTGRVPVVDRQPVNNIALRYFAGGGKAGNISSNAGFEAVANAGLKGRTIVPAVGGDDAELLESATRRSASALRLVERAITGLDHETLAITTEGVAFSRAYAALGHHPLHPCRRVPGAVTIYVVPYAPRGEASDYDLDCAYVAAPKPDAGALQAARARVEKARLVGSEVFVLAAEYRMVLLAVEARGDPTDSIALKSRIRIALQRFLDPLCGGAQKTGWPFGEPLRPSVLLVESQRAAGDDASIMWVAIGLDGQPPTENCQDVAIEPHQLVVLHDVAVRVRPEANSQGGLR